MPKSRYCQSSGVLHLLGRQLRQDVRSTRTGPAEGFRKMFRDVAHSEGKEIDFRTTGLEIQADRLVLPAPEEPLMHAPRNAVCHGTGVRNVEVTPNLNDQALRHYAWVTDNRARVDKESGGKLAYVYLPNTHGAGHDRFVREFYAQIGKQGVIIDDLFNGGGFRGRSCRPWTWALRHHRRALQRRRLPRRRGHPTRHAPASAAASRLQRRFPRRWMT